MSETIPRKSFIEFNMVLWQQREACVTGSSSIFLAKERELLIALPDKPGSGTPTRQMERHNLPPQDSINLFFREEQAHDDRRLVVVVRDALNRSHRFCR